MRRLRNVSLWGLGLALIASPSLVSGAPQSPVSSSAPVVEDSRHAPEEFEGAWDYNAAESVNAATGKPEQAPRSATRGGGGRGSGSEGGATAGRARSGSPAGAGGTGGGQPGVGGGARVGGEGTLVGPTPEMMRAARDLTRDLMEIPETLTISVSPDAVTFVDDLNRKRTYSTDGRKQKYQLGASSFDARAEWKDGQLRKDIDGGYGFKMSEVYFLSPDGKRLFVILRVGETKKNTPPVGADRVYDRVVR
jgi:hypothetical protein